MATESERSAIDHVAQRLSRQFANLDSNVVARVVWDTYGHFDAHPTRDVERSPLLNGLLTMTGIGWRASGGVSRAGRRGR